MPTLLCGNKVYLILCYNEFYMTGLTETTLNRLSYSEMR